MAKKILLVIKKDSNDDAEARILRNHGFDVVTAHSEEQAIRLLQQNADISLVLLDTILRPAEGGTRIAREILTYRDLPIVFLIQTADPRFTDTLTGITSYGYVPKGSDHFFLIESIQMAFKLFEAHQATKESEEKYRAAFMTSPDSVNINRIDGLYVDVNEGFCSLTGYSREEVIGKFSSEIDIWAIPEDRQRLVESLQREGKMENLESQFRCKDGSLKTGLMSARLITIRNQPHILSITRDISSKKAVEEQLIRSEQRYRSIFDNAADGILIGDNQGIITDANVSMTQLTGYSKEELVGQNIMLILQADELNEKPLRYDLVYKGTTVQRERTIVTKSGTHLPIIMNTRKV